MKNTDPRVDAYIAKAKDFAKPILEHLRELVHQAVPEATETIKWGMPNFEYKGIICHMASFKAHVAFGFWKGSIMSDPHGIMNDVGNSSMGRLGKITSLDDLPDDHILIEYIRQAQELNEMGVKVPTKAKASPKELEVPDYFNEELAKHPKAQETWEQFTYSKRKDYVEWVTGAKTDATREKRLNTTMEWLAEGKSRNWKYENC